MINVIGITDDAMIVQSRKEGEKAVFDESKKKPTVSYRGDGRKEIDGVLKEGTQGANSLWTATITRGVAHQWKDKSEGRVEKAKRYLRTVTNDTRVYIRENRYVSVIALVLLNTFLLYLLYRLL